jgi:hypothetical protein
LALGTCRAEALLDRAWVAGVATTAEQLEPGPETEPAGQLQLLPKPEPVVTVQSGSEPPEPTAAAGLWSEPPGPIVTVELQSEPRPGPVAAVKVRSKPCAGAVAAAELEPVTVVRLWSKAEQLTVTEPGPEPGPVVTDGLRPELSESAVAEVVAVK